MSASLVFNAYSFQLINPNQKSSLSAQLKEVWKELKGTVLNFFI